ncbi:alpha-D-ribose 1-methylphosphonate 5-triphosphate diphosphatase, partial [Pseudomonas syringae]
RHLWPRPGGGWPARSAGISHDAQIVAAGSTTVLDALSIGDINPKGKRMQQLPAMLQAIADATAAGLTRAEHVLHLRCEVSHPDTLSVFRDLVDQPLVQLAPGMDQAPGPRRFALESKDRAYHMGKYPLNSGGMDRLIVGPAAN